MKKIFTLLFVFIAFLIPFFSCTKENHSPENHTNVITLPPEGSSVVNASNSFAFTFLHAALQQDQANNNKLISPLSIYLALSMVYNGTDNATKDSIAHALQLAGIDIRALNEVCNALITQLPAEDNKVQFSIANSIWYNENKYQPLPSFLSAVQSSYDAAIKPADFANPSTANTINNWVAEQTNNKIQQIIGTVSPYDLMYLINAIYFKGAWQNLFPSSGTHDDVFYTAMGETKSVSFMTNKQRVSRYSDSLFTMVELPYGGGKSFSMYIALPNNRQLSADAFAASMSEAAFTHAMSKMDTVQMEITIPKWEYAYSIENMRPALSLLGMGNAFAEGADFSKMFNSNQVQPYITKASHKTYIMVNEEGAEAAAVTVIGIGLTSVAEPLFFKADHPFFYAIVEKQTGTILFTGILNAPSGN